jgi:hypothetical protein
MDERSTISLENQKTRSILRADKAEQKLREEQARQQRLDLGSPKPKSTEDPFRKKTDEFARRLEAIDETLAEKIRAKVGDKPEAEWTEDEREHVALLRNYCEKERHQLMDRS